jgi:glycosyltransferase involved in cell wall biosynthesis
VSRSSKILYVQYTNPAAYPSLEHGSRILARRGWQVLFLGTGADGAAALRFPPHSNITVRRLSFCPAGWRQKFHYLWFCLWVLGWTLRWRPACVYASDFLSCPVALLVSHAGSRVVYHEHDSPAEPGAEAFSRVLLWARRRLARRATCCVLPNETRAQRFTDETGNGHGVLCVRNCPSLDDVSEARAPVSGETLWVLYHGSIVPARLPRAVLEALTLIPDAIRLRVIGYETAGHRGYVSELRKVCAGLRLGERVEFLGTLPAREELLAQGRSSDVGLALLPMRSVDANLRAMTGASNKPFDYLACGLPLVVSDLPDWRATFVAPGYALACDPADPESIATTLRWFLDHPLEMRAMGERGRQRILADWNYEAEFAPVLQRLPAVGR